jgi:DNA polymerase-1
MSNPLLVWEKKHIETEQDLQQMVTLYNQDKPVIVGGDTESTGLNIIKDKAFLIVFGWVAKGVKGGRVFTFYPTQRNMKIFFDLAKRAKYFFFWNTKFDIHMMNNTGFEYTYNNLAEGMVLARLTLEAKPARDGGDSLRLKDIAKKYVHSSAADDEAEIKIEKEKLEKLRIKVLAAALKQFPMDGEFTASGKQKFWGKGAIEKFLKDPTNDLEDLPEGVREVWTDWQKDYPEVTYADIDRNLMIKYAANDVIIMLEFVKNSWAVLLYKKQLEVFHAENAAILPLYRMERVGMKVDRTYLEQARQNVKSYIIEKRNEMYALIGDKINTGQHDAIKAKFKSLWNIHLESDDKNAMKSIIKSFDGDAKRYAELITMLRTLEKWYSTYILRILDISKHDGRAYTQIHQASAVSGRVGSDFQQFPKNPLKDEDGNILFHPRKPFTVTGNGYDAIWYLDFSQIELRMTAHYTVLVSGGDKNLCRAYMPFQCVSKKTGKVFDHNSKKDLANWNTGEWVDETGAMWTPTDVHGATTSSAYPTLEVGSEEFKKMRSKGKMVNFLKNYGGSIGAILSQVDGIDYETAKRLDEGYYAAFPDVLKYQKLVVGVHGKRGYVENAFGRRYYIENSRDAYKLTNYIIQGSCADDLKRKIVQIDALLLKYRSRFQMNIHDELSFEIYNGEEFLVPKIKAIMEKADFMKVPCVSDIEVTYTTWADKYDIKLEEIAA